MEFNKKTTRVSGSCASEVQSGYSHRAFEDRDHETTYGQDIIANDDAGLASQNIGNAHFELNADWRSGTDNVGCALDVEGK